MQKKMPRGKLPDRRSGPLLAIGFFVFLLSGLVGAQEFGAPCRLYGPIDFLGDAPPDGRAVVALIRGEEAASCQTKDGQYYLEVPQDNPATSKKDGWSEGDTMTIKVGGLAALPKIPASAGSKWVKLTVSSSDVKPTVSTWGKIKALFK
ncbi:MAG: hypothetical protein WCE90_03220 [Candidatus Zixiibacteriota bacterium]